MQAPPPLQALEASQAGGARGPEGASRRAPAAAGKRRGLCCSRHAGAHLLQQAGGAHVVIRDEEGDLHSAHQLGLRSSTRGHQRRGRARDTGTVAAAAPRAAPGSAGSELGQGALPVLLPPMKRSGGCGCAMPCCAAGLLHCVKLRCTALCVLRPPLQSPPAAARPAAPTPPSSSPPPAWPTHC